MPAKIYHVNLTVEERQELLKMTSKGQINARKMKRTDQDFAHQMRWLVDVADPDAEYIDLIMDKLNTHKPASLYETFPPEKANRILKRLVFHFTPKHGSRLNMAECEFSVFLRKLGSHVPDEATLMRKVAAIEDSRNRSNATVHWQFTSQDARTRLEQLYPSYSS